MCSPIHIALRQYKRSLKQGSSKWWGSADLPQNLEYPTYVGADGEEYQYIFICQIRCEDLAQFDQSGALPPKGLLYFFAKIDHYMEFEVEEADIPGLGLWPEDAVKVIYVEDVEGQRLQTVIMVDEDNYPVAPSAFGIKFSDKKKKNVIGDVHQVLGEPYLLPQAEWDSPCQGWRLLLQVDSFDGDDFGLLFMNMGLLYFIIDPEDLKARNFDRVRGYMVSM